MHRHELTDKKWELLEGMMPEGAGRPPARGNRNFINAVIWIARTGAPWRDLPERFGPWQSIYNRFLRWARKGTFGAIFKALALPKQDVASLLDATVVRAHQDASGGRGGQKKNEIGRSRGGCSTKIHAVSDSEGMPLHIEITQGQVHDSVMSEELIAHAPSKAIVADTAYDSHAFHRTVRGRKLAYVVKSHPNRKMPPLLNRRLYRLRINIEKLFHKLKRFRRIASRYEKRGHCYKTMVEFACMMLWVGEVMI